MDTLCNQLRFQPLLPCGRGGSFDDTRGRPCRMCRARLIDAWLVKQLLQNAADWRGLSFFNCRNQGCQSSRDQREKLPPPTRPGSRVSWFAEKFYEFLLSEDVNILFCQQNPGKIIKLGASLLSLKLFKRQIRQLRIMLGLFILKNSILCFDSS